MESFGRREILGGAGAAMLLALPGCAGTGGISLTEAIRRLLLISSQNALAQLAVPNGFYDSEVSRLALPDRFGGSQSSSLLVALLTSGPFKSELQRTLNRAAEKGAERAAPLIADTVRTMSISDALALVRGGPSAATAFLRGRMGSSLVETMLPGVSDGMRVFDNGVVARALDAATGIDFSGLAREMTVKADTAIWSAIGMEEASIRANPRQTDDPLLISVFTAAAI